MLMNYHIGRLVLSSLCVGAFVAVDIWLCSFCRLKHYCGYVKGPPANRVIFKC